MDTTSDNAVAAVDAAAFGNVMTPIIENIISPLIMLAFAIAIVAFAWGMVQMIIHDTDAEARSKGRWTMLGGLIGIFIMLSAWGIIRIIANTVGEFN